VDDVVGVYGYRAFDVAGALCLEEPLDDGAHLVLVHFSNSCLCARPRALRFHGIMVRWFSHVKRNLAQAVDG
jgi:hypothetical protein